MLATAYVYIIVYIAILCSRHSFMISMHDIVNLGYYDYIAIIHHYNMDYSIIVGCCCVRICSQAISIGKRNYLMSGR